jgi:hypothetical protein
MRINNTSLCWNEVAWESITHEYGGMRYHENQQYILTDLLLILMWTHSRILICNWFSYDLILAYWCIIDCRVTLFQHTDVLLILMVPHSTILMCYWFSFNLIPAYWCVIDSDGTAFQHTDVLTILVWPYFSILKDSWFSGDLKYCWLRWPHSTILMYYWLSCDLIPAYWHIVDSHGTSFHHEVEGESITH